MVPVSLYHVRDYHQASDKILMVPLELTERDFAVLHEFGGPQDERRGRDAQRQAQLALVPTPAPPLRTKAIDPPPARVGLRPEVQARLTAEAIWRAVEPLARRVAALEQRVAQLDAAHQALAEVVLSDLELVPPRPAEPSLDPPEPSLDPGPARQARRTH